MSGVFSIPSTWMVSVFENSIEIHSNNNKIKQPGGDSSHTIRKNNTILLSSFVASGTADSQTEKKTNYCRDGLYWSSGYMN